MYYNTSLFFPFPGFVSGPTEFYDCEETIPQTYSWSASTSSSWDIGGGVSGISVASFDSGSNHLPSHPLEGSMTYPSIDGKMEITGMLALQISITHINTDILDLY